MNRVGLLVGALVVVLLVAWLAGVFDTEFSTVDVPTWSFDRTRAEELSLRSRQDTVLLTHREDKWVITKPVEADVDSIRLDRFLSDLEKLRFGSVVTNRRGKQGEYGVDSTASSIAVRSGKDRVVLYVGGTGADYQTVYVRLGGDDRVFASRGRISVDAAPESWRDRTIISVPQSAVVRVEVSRDSGSFAVSRTSGSWVIEGSGETQRADSSAVERWIRRFAPLKGVRFSTREAFDSASPLVRMTFETVGGSSASLEIREAESDLLVAKPGSGDVLTASSGLKDSLVPEASTLMTSD